MKFQNELSFLITNQFHFTPELFFADGLAVRIKAQNGLVHHAEGLLEGLLKVAPDAHHLAHALHAAPDLGAHPAELAQVPPQQPSSFLTQNSLDSGQF